MFFMGHVFHGFIETDVIHILPVSLHHKKLIPYNQDQRFL
jgi:hypothetical protein